MKPCTKHSSFQVQNDPKYKRVKNCSWDDVFISLVYDLKVRDFGETVGLYEDCKLSQEQIEKKTLRSLKDLFNEFVKKVYEMAGADKSKSLAIPLGKDSALIWKEVLNKIKVRPPVIIIP